MPTIKAQDEHPLQKWMSQKAFLVVKPYVKYTKNTNLANLLKEEHVEVALNVELVFDDRFEAEGYGDEYREYSHLKFTFRLEGKTTDTCIELSAYQTCCSSKLRIARDTLAQRLASLCTCIKRLSIHCNLDGMPYPSYREDSSVQEEFMEWADTGLVLKAFAEAAFWTVSLVQLDILGDTELPSDDDLEGSVLITKPQNLKVLRLSCNDYDEEADGDIKARNFIKAFPTLETLRIQCHQGKSTFNFHFPRFFRGMSVMNPNLKTIHLEGDKETVNLGGKGYLAFVFELLTLRLLENLTLHLEGDQQHDHYYTDATVSVLKFTSIKEISLKGLSGTSQCFDVLIDYLSEDDCLLRYFDLDTECLKDEQLETLLSLLSMKETQLPLTPDLKSLDALLILRRFRDVMPSDMYHHTAKLWPHLLANCGNWKRHMKGMSKNAASRWFFSREQLSMSLMYSLIRERVDIISDHLASRKVKHDGDTAKRPLNGEAIPVKRAKVELA